MKISIVGAGAVGGMMGAACAAAGHEVSLVARGAHLEALQRDGLRVDWAGGEPQQVMLPASDDPADFGAQDAVVLALKAYSIAEMLPRLAPVLGAETAVVPAINGLPWWYFERLPGRLGGQRIECLDPGGAMARVLDARRLIGCVVHAAGEVVAPGVVKNTSGRRYILGELDGADSPRLRALCEALSAGGCDARPSTSIRNDVWMKLIGNLAFNPVAALTLARIHEIRASDGLIRLIRNLMKEAMTVAEFYGERVTLSIDERLELARALGASKNSMHQDLERGRPLEIDAIIGSVLELAGKAALAVPAIDAVHALICERARH